MKNINRSRTAIQRGRLSKPIILALNYSLISPDTKVFDYGCGKGGDIKYCKSIGIDTYGWDPVYFPDSPLLVTDIVNLGYVVNVIEDFKERCDVLKDAWRLTKKMLIVSARLKYELSENKFSSYNDGFVTSWNTFQKFYDQQELREWIDTTLGIRCVAVELGIFFIFRDETDRQEFLSKRYQRRRAAPRLRRSDVLYEQHKDSLKALIDFVVERGRLPHQHEIENASELMNIFGSIKQAFNVVKRVTGTKQWEHITNGRVQDLLVYLSLEKFHGRPHFSELPDSLQLDIRACFGSYTNACQQADDLLYSLRDLAVVDNACQEASYGKLTPTALYIHKDGLNILSPILRLYVGCSRALVGEVNEANILKLNRHKPKVSYLYYPDFEKDPHPEIKGSLVVSLDKRKIKYYNYSNSSNPFILHRKEDFIPKDHSLWSKFARFTKQEENWGILNETSQIGTRNGWQSILNSKGVKLKGHRLVKVTP